MRTSQLFSLFATSAVALAACDRRHEPAADPQPASLGAASGGTGAAGTGASAVASAAPACKLAPLPLRIPMPHRAVAIGDLHGDLDAARAALRAAGAIDARDQWVGGDLVVIQTGDVLDRGDGESAILALLDRLAADARAHGGALIQLLGNHELMNAAADFRYVTPGGMRDFDGDRARELGPGGVWSKRLAAHDAVAIVGDTVLSHAGVLPAWAAQLDAMNLDARCWLAGDITGPAAALTADDSPVWTRAYGGDRVDCAELDQALAALGAKRMVVAHTVQPGGINARCDDKLWRIDTGMSSAYGGPIQVLELGNPPKVIAGAR